MQRLGTKHGIEVSQTEEVDEDGASMMQTGSMDKFSRAVAVLFGNLEKREPRQADKMSKFLLDMLRDWRRRDGSGH